MANIENGICDIGCLDRMADHNSIIHKLDARSKVLTTILFIIMVVSTNKYEIAGLVPFTLMPIILIALADFPFSFFLHKLILVSPFVLFVAIFNPFFDQAPLCKLGHFTISGGWVSFLSIILRFCLTVTAALVLIASTGFPQVCRALEQLGVPKVFTIQLLFLYRYIFVLLEEGTRMIRSHNLRSFGRKIHLRVYKHLAGNLLLRTLDRANRIHMAMLCRGFDGEIRSLNTDKFNRSDYIFTITTCSLVVIFRLVNLPQFAGTLFIRLF
ncbi:MAG: cobalt ECF transporter T component CbiQ [Desulfobulbaceae bacterium]|nr:cobalt ECF transporter T component CbiQ [Desulfobulbaceae bacterium]